MTGPAGIGPANAGPVKNGGHVIVCGLQGVGLRTVEQLHLSDDRAYLLGPYEELLSVLRRDQLTS
jgi:Zn-dependent alcohol dehydrogenase